MPILTGDIKLVASQVMDDVPEGGGAPTATVITDGTSNAIFPDISELDRAGGRVNLRKLHVSVQTTDTDTYMGSNVIIAEPPADPNVSITLFTTRDTFDRRAAAANTIESYLIRASMWPGFLLENHVAGQRVIQIFQRPTQADPTIGRTLVLVMNEDQAGERLQYVRVIRVESTIGTYMHSDGTEYQAKVCTCEISDVLRYAFAGSSPSKTFAPAAGKTLIRDTSVADAGAYCGVVALKQAAGLGASKVSTKSVYTQLVPSAATEKVELDITPTATRTLTLASTPREVKVGMAPHSMRVKIGQENRSYSYIQILHPLPAPGSVEVSFMALGEWYSLLDDGAGGFTGEGAGTVNYLTGTISVTLPALPDSSSSLIFAWGEKLGYTNMSGLATFRQPEFSFDLSNKGIDPGSLVITWLSGGVLKTAMAAADGTLSGDASGFVAHTIGQVSLRPSAMLDSGGEFSLSYTWSTTRTETKTGLSASSGGVVTFSTDEVPVEGSVMVEWITTRQVSATSGSKLASGSSTKSASSNSGTSSTQAMASKTIHHNAAPAYSVSYSGGGTIGSGSSGSTGWVSSGAIAPPAIPWLPAWDETTVSARLVTASVTSDTASGSSSKLTISSSQVSDTVISVYHSITENGSGGFLNTLGTINYGGKTVTLKVVDPSTTALSYSNDTESASDFSAAQTSSSADPGQTAGWYRDFVPANSASLSSSSGGSSSAQGGSYTTTSVKEVFDGTALFVTYRTGASASTPHTESFAPGVVQIDLAPYTQSRIVPNSIRFTWMGHVYQDLDGKLYRDPTTGSPGTSAGIVDYITGLAHVTDYIVAGSPSALTLDSLWVNKGGWTTSKVFFRTPSAPIKPGGLSMSILDVSGTQIIATADLNGNIIGDHCLGAIDYQSGVVDMIFGDLVLDSALSAEDKAEWWYAKALTQITAEGKLWRPWPVDPNSLRFNAVSYFYLPLDADLLGIDPVRLPQDGRVTIFRPGGFCVVGNTQSITATVSNGQTINCARVRLSRVRVLGFDGNVINVGYSVDLEAGLVTFTAVSGYSQPVTIEHRVEDMAVVSDVQITGQISFTRQLTHEYPADTSFVSSALVAGDLKARVSVLFDQATWNGTTWQDTVSGSIATGTYNDVLTPIVVTNKGAVSERWALVFTNTSSFNVIGEHVGVIAIGSINADLSPINPATSTPYFTVLALGWGIGWAAGNLLRFNTVGAMTPVWVVRTIQQGPNTGVEHSFTLLSRGDVDRP